MRPTILFYKGGYVNIEVHDAYYLAEKKAWKRRLARQHPDRLRQIAEERKIHNEAHREFRRYKRAKAAIATPATRFKTVAPYKRVTGAVFRELVVRRRNWLRLEVAWYAQFGLEPPDGKVAIVEAQQGSMELSA